MSDGKSAQNCTLRKVYFEPEVGLVINHLYQRNFQGI